MPTTRFLGSTSLIQPLASARFGLELPLVSPPGMKPRLFQRHSSEESECEELRKVLNRLRACRPRTRCAIGAGVSIANEDFIRRFRGIELFRQSPGPEQAQFWADLGDLELGLRSDEGDMALGVGLYRIWLTDSLAGKHELAELLGEELSELSRKHSFHG